MRMSVGVDLHKSQFTVYWQSDDGSMGKHERYATTEDGYQRFEMIDRLKRAKGSGSSIIATARKLSEIIYRMLTDGVPFDEYSMIDPAIRRKVMEMQAAALNVA